MGRARHLAKAPIAEAIMDIQFVVPDSSVNRSKAVLGPYWHAGWEKQEQRTFSAQISPAAGEISAGPSTLDAYGALSPDGTEVIRVGSDRVTVSRLKTYTNWEDLWARTLEAFQPFVEASCPTEVRRVGARFINRLAAADALGSYERLLERPPLMVLREGLEGARIANFLRRHVVEDLPGGFTAILTIGSVTPAPGEQATSIGPVVLDIDVFKKCQLPIDIGVIKSEFDRIRDIKNELFFGSLTDECLERLE